MYELYFGRNLWFEVGSFQILSYLFQNISDELVQSDWLSVCIVQTAGKSPTSLNEMKIRFKPTDSPLELHVLWIHLKSPLSFTSMWAVAS